MIPLHSVHAVSESIVWVAGASSLTGPLVLKTTDGGDNWVGVTGDIDDIPNVGPANLIAIDSLRAWIGDYWGRIIATVNGGLSWTQQAVPPPSVSNWIAGLCFFDAANGYVLGDDLTPGGRLVFLRTTDGGTTWSHLANEPVMMAGETPMGDTFCCTDRQHVWFGTNNSLVWRTTDGGDTWLSATPGSGIVNALAMHDDSVGIACLGPTEPGRFARTTDGGATWQPLSGVTPEMGVLAAFPAGSTNAWVAAPHAVACSRDNGETWVLQPTDPFDGSLNAISFSDPTNGWIVTSNGEILRYRDLSGPLAVRPEGERELPVQTLLQQNYPNPFNPSTTIKFELHEAAEVRLSVFDILGREVSVLVNEKRDAGVHDVRFDASGLSSGVYFYRLTAGDFEQVRKFLLLK